MDAQLRWQQAQNKLSTSFHEDLKLVSLRRIMRSWHTVASIGWLRSRISDVCENDCFAAVPNVHEGVEGQIKIPAASPDGMSAYGILHVRDSGE
ncbi:hypothetical protein BC937DRAFT_92064 [Endogone sp. FLAS-F59071]|nr:hypothetical protein BC937DRAFT_92064 [Endogone sp. FLAS-F59071]|eukprot:RUS23131.1 hypothetical protein BC937DRAFT_92064 [Endogone sp. FLAS-F59071]